MEEPVSEVKPVAIISESPEKIENDAGEVQWSSDASSPKYAPNSSIDEEDESPANSPKPPDGGFGWIIVIAVFFIHVILDGVNFSFGILLPYIIDEMHASPSEASSIVSVLMGITFFCGPFSSVLSSKFGHRTVAVSGAIIATCGAICGFFSTAAWHLTITYGAVMGLGFGGIYLPAVVSAVSWFDKKRARAVGIAVCGSGIGIMMFSYLIPFLVEELGLHGCLLIQAGIIANTIAFSSLLRPLPHEEKEASRKRRLAKRKDSVELDELPKNGEKDLRIRVVTPEDDRNGCQKALHALSSMPIFRMWQYWVMLLVVFLCGLSGYIPFVYINHRAETEAKIPRSDTNLIVMVTGGCNLLGRLFAGVTDHPWINRLLVYSLSFILSGVATALSTLFCVDLISFCVYGAIYGFSAGIIIALQSVVLTDIVGLDNMSAAFGISLFVLGISSLGGPPIAGAIVAAQDNSYTLTFVLFGLIFAVGGLIFLVVPLSKYIQRWRSGRTEANVADSSAPA